MSRQSSIIVAIAAVGLSACPAILLAQSYPAKPVKIMHGFAAGGAGDTVLRQIAARLEPTLGAPIVVENRPGASGTVAAAAVARAAPDGYTLLFGVAANMAVAPALMKNPPYDPVTAFTPIIEVARGPYVWLVRADAPARSMAEFVAWAKSNPGKLNYASPGNGSVHHLATEMLKRAAGIDIVHIPYSGGLYVALLGGQVDAMFESMPGPMPHLSAGKLRALGVTGPRRLAALPDVPTLSEQGFLGLDVNSWWGVVGPAGLPASIVTQLNDAITRALADPELQATLDKMSIRSTPGTPAAFRSYIESESLRWKEAVMKSGLALD